MTFGLSAGAIAGIAATVGGAVISANGAKSAANTQANATNAATQLTKDQWQQTLANTASYRNTGDAATYRLAQLLGLSPQMPTSSANTNTVPTGATADQLRTQLLPQFTTTSYQPSGSYDERGTGSSVPVTSIDEAGLNAEISRQLGAQAAQQSQESQSGGAAGAQSADFGSLLTNPYSGPFTAQDYQQFKDPGYDFMLKQGSQALQNSQAANGGVLSGAALKGLISYNQDYANTGFGAAYGRYTDSFNRLKAQQDSVYNRLSNLAGVGANAAVGTGNTGAQLAGTAAASTVAGGNAQAQGTIGAANAVNSGLGGAAGYYQLNQLLKPPTSSDSYGFASSSPMSGLLYSNGSLAD